MNPGTGLLLLDKPAGITSFAALAPIKRTLASGKVGHAGTLDSFATGLLLLFVGSFTRLLPWFSGCTKRYRATILFGSETDTLDPEGRIVATAPPPRREALESVLPSFHGRILQVPPLWSALHIDGKRAYERALAGEKPEMKSRPVDIHSLELESFDGERAIVTVGCGPGTYIRSLARDIAVAAGSCAHLVELQRQAVGAFLLKDAVLPENFRPVEHLIDFSPRIASSIGLNIRFLDESRHEAFLNGISLSSTLFNSSSEYADPAKVQSPGSHPAGVSETADVAVYTPDARFLGIVQLGDVRVRYRLVIGRNA